MAEPGVIEIKVIPRMPMAVLDEKEIVFFHCIRHTDGMAVIERARECSGNEEMYFETVPAERVRVIQHYMNGATLSQMFEFLVKGKS